MSDLSVTNTFVPSTTAVASQVNTNFSDITTYINNRSSGSSKWDSLAVAGNAVIDGTLTVSGVTIGVLAYINVKDMGRKGMQRQMTLLYSKRR